MDIKEKKILVSLISSILIFTIYTVYVFQNSVIVNPEILNDFGFWGKSFLILIPVSIVAQIVIQIIFAIFNALISPKETEALADERDKLIELKAIKITHYIFITGFMLAMGVLAFDMQPWLMFVTLIASGFISAVANDFTRLYFYRKGV
jgi:hypothetical protein